jgi:carbonic anhydrase
MSANPMVHRDVEQRQPMHKQEAYEEPPAQGGGGLIIKIVAFLSFLSVVLTGALMTSVNKLSASLMPADGEGDGHGAAHGGDSHEGGGHDWNWEGATGPNFWGTLGVGDEDCVGTYEQSPIDIPATMSGYAGTSSSSDPIKAMLSSAPNKFIVTQSHGAPKFSCKAEGTCGTLTHNGKAFKLLQVHFHSPSEHTVDGKHYPLCAHLVHVGFGGEVAVLGVLFEATAKEDDASDAISLVNNMWGYMSGSDEEMASNINVYDSFVSSASGYYNYKGSFTTPPCTEGVNWFVQAEAIKLKASQVDFFWDQIGGYPGNSRPTMPLNSRSINYMVDKPVWAWTPYDKDGAPVGPAAWTGLGYSDCAGSKQSPIDFPVTAAGVTGTGNLLQGNDLKSNIVTSGSYKFKVSQSHGAPKYACKSAGACGSIRIPSTAPSTSGTMTDFDLVQVHFHSMSEHTIDGKAYPLCAHMVHQSALGEYAVVGILFDATEDEGASTATTTLVDTLFGYMASDGVYTDETINLQDTFVSASSGFYSYEGSFTTPPCTEGVNWIVQAEIQKVKASQVKMLFNHIGGYPGNYRPPQPIGSRAIAYNVQ